jgi:hypothetical protein
MRIYDSAGLRKGGQLIGIVNEHGKSQENHSTFMKYIINISTVESKVGLDYLSDIASGRIEAFLKY